MSYTFTLSWDNRAVVLPFPVVPNEGVTIGETSNHQTIDALNGQMLMIGRKNLRTVSISSFFPRKAYPWMGENYMYTKKVATDTVINPTYYYEGGYRYESTLIHDGTYYVTQINHCRAQKKPMRIVLCMGSAEILNMPCVITNFQWGRDQAGDIQYSLSFTEYVFPSYSTGELGESAEPSDAVAAVNHEAEVASLLTTSGQAAAAVSSAELGDYTKLYTEQQAKQMACHIISGMGYSADVYYNDSTCYGSYKQYGGYTRLITRKTLYATEMWCVLNTCDNVDGGSLSKTISSKFNSYKDGDLTTGYYDYNPANMTSKIYDFYGTNLYELACDVLNRWSAEKAGNSNVGRLLPKDYQCQWGDGFLVHYFNYYIYGKSSNHAAYAKAHLSEAWQFTASSPY